MATVELGGLGALPRRGLHIAPSGALNAPRLAAYFRRTKC
jgi:hypothetical protein